MKEQPDIRGENPVVSESKDEFRLRAVTRTDARKVVPDDLTDTFEEFGGITRDAEQKETKEQLHNLSTVWAILSDLQYAKARLKISVFLMAADISLGLTDPFHDTQNGTHTGGNLSILIAAVILGLQIPWTVQTICKKKQQNT